MQATTITAISVPFDSLFFSSLTLRAFRLEVIALCHATVGLPPAVVSADDGKPLGETIFLK